MKHCTLTGLGTPWHKHEAGKVIVSIHSLSDASRDREQMHADKVLALFRDHPEFARNALIIVPPTSDGEGITLAPEHMSQTSIVGMLEMAKVGVALSAYMRAVEEP